jgi:hypothetical protein
MDVLLGAFHPYAPTDHRILDVVRLFGRGVASMPAERYVVLWDRGDAGMADDGLWMLREVTDPTVVPGLAEPLEGVFDAGGERLADATRQLWGGRALDPFMAWVSDGPMAFKSQSWSAYQQGFNHDHIQDQLVRGELEPDDAVAFGRFMGALLADAHAHAPTRGGQPGLDVISNDLDGRVDELADELAAVVMQDVPRVLLWSELFEEALDELGPWLGAEHVMGSP